MAETQRQVGGSQAPTPSPGPCLSQSSPQRLSGPLLWGFLTGSSLVTGPTSSPSPPRRSGGWDSSSELWSHGGSPGSPPGSRHPLLLGKASQSHLICRMQITFIPLTRGNSKGLRSSVPGTADENQVCVLLINHTVTDADTDDVPQAHLAFIFLTPCQPPCQGVAFGAGPGDRLSVTPGLLLCQPLHNRKSARPVRLFLAVAPSPQSFRSRALRRLPGGCSLHSSSGWVLGAGPSLLTPHLEEEPAVQPHLSPCYCWQVSSPAWESPRGMEKTPCLPALGSLLAS